jgi:hypothetical protein
MLNGAFEAQSGEQLEWFYHWLHVNVLVNVSAVRDTMDRCFRARDTQRALRLYDAMMQGYSPRRQVALIVVAWAVILVLGAIGGAVYLLNLVFW